MVAAGKNHCLALTADGFVKAWGRNKNGQLGVGTLRDKTEPKWVCHKSEDDGDLDGPRLGSRSDPRESLAKTNRDAIVTISAGGNSSIAAALNADVWQWGELNGEFKMDDGKDKEKDKKHKGREKEASGGNEASKARPYRVASFKSKSFRSQMRKEKEKVSITDTLCMVLDKDDGAKSRIKDLVEEDKRWRTEIGKERQAARDAQNSRHGKKDDHKAGGDGGDNDGAVGDLQDTIAFIERDIDKCHREIDLYTKNIASATQQQKHNRKQIEMLTHQATQLTESQGHYSQQMLEGGKKSGQQKKQLETQLSEIKDFIEANANTRATLLDQRAETDKENQRLKNELAAKNKHLHELEKRLTLVKDLGSTTKNSSVASDQWVSFLGKEKEKLNYHFEGKPLGNSELVEAKKKLEKDEAYLRKVEFSMHVMLQSSRDRGNVEGLRPKVCKALLDDLVDLRRRLNDLMSDKYFKEDLNFDCFFKAASAPSQP